MTNPNEPAFPELHIHHFLTDSEGKEKAAVVPRWMGGLTKREYFAALAMQGFSANPGRNENSFAADAEASVKQADAIISELNKEPKQ